MSSHQWAIFFCQKQQNMLTRILPLLLQISHQTKQREVCPQKQTPCSTYIPTCAKHQPDNMLRCVVVYRIMTDFFS